MNSTPSVDSSQPPLVTVGLAVYNNERYVAQSIEALLNQTFRNFVLIISDNASTDLTGEICQRYAKQDPRIQYSRNSVNIGMNGNFNRVFGLSRSKYFKWATGDDLSGREMLADAVAVLEADPSIALCYPRTVTIDGEGKEQGTYDDSLHLMQDDPATRFLAVIENIGLVNHHLGLLRSDAIRRTQLFGKYVGADIAFIAEMSLYGKFFQVPKHQFYRRFHTESSSWNRGDQEQEARRFHAANVRRVPFGTWLSHQRLWTAVLRSPLDVPQKARVCARLCKRMAWASGALIDDLRSDLPSLLGFGRHKSAPPK